MKPIIKQEKHEQSEFMEYVQLHERAWGLNSYPNRPTLTEILKAPVVIFWKVERKESFTVSLHQNLREIELLLLRMLFKQAVDTPRQKPARIFEHQKRLIIKDVKVEFEEAKD